MDNNIINEINGEYGDYLIYICKKIKSSFKGIPIRWEDLYNQFLSTSYKLYLEFDVTKGVSLKTYLGLKCKFNAYNMCRSFGGVKHSIFNNSIEFNDEILLNTPYEDEDDDYEEDQLEYDRLLRTYYKIFNRKERKVLNMKYVKKMKNYEIANELSISLYKISKIINIIKIKLKDKNIV